MRIQICRYVDDWQPGWVECKLVDASGHEHLFVEKVPVVTAALLDAGSSYPQPGVIACVVVGKRAGSDGREIIEVDTETPDGVESTTGRSRFEVFPEQIRGYELG